MTPSFGSDNHSGAHPHVIAAIVEANTGHVNAYGEDPWTERAEAMLRAAFGADTVPLLVATGTGANVIALQSCLRPWESVICAQTAHINVDESGAPERVTGSKLVALPTPDGRLDPTQLAPVCARDDEHHSRTRVLSITQSSEYGTAYSVEHAAALTAEARRLGLLIHVDGARLANAAAHLGQGLGQTARMFDADVVSFGGTKNGLIGAEAVVWLNPQLAQHAKWIRKSSTQLMSKHRYLAAQFIALLDNDLWLTNASHANAMASRLAAALSKAPGVRLTQPVEANAVFAVLPDHHVADLQKRFGFYDWDQAIDEYRLMCSWDTPPEAVDDLATALS